MSFRQRFDNVEETRSSMNSDIEWLEQLRYCRESRIKEEFNNEDNLFRFFITLDRYPDPAGFIAQNPQIFTTLQAMVDGNFWYMKKQAEDEKFRGFVLPARDVTPTGKNPKDTALSILHQRDKILVNQQKSKHDSPEAKLIVQLNKMSPMEFSEFVSFPQHPKYDGIYQEIIAIAKQVEQQPNPTPEQYVCYVLVCEDTNKIDPVKLDESLGLMQGDIREHIQTVLNRTADIAEHKSAGFFSLIKEDHDKREGGLDRDCYDLPVNMSGAVLNDVDASRFDWGANLRAMNLSGAVFNNCRFPFANLRGANLTGAVLDGVDLSHADLSGAIFTDVKVQGNGVVIKDPKLFSESQAVLSVEQAKKSIDGFRQLKIPDKEIAAQFDKYIVAVRNKDAGKAEKLVEYSTIMFGKADVKAAAPGKSVSDQTDYRGGKLSPDPTKNAKKSGFLRNFSFLGKKSSSAVTEEKDPKKDIGPGVDNKLRK